jgi:hypothetical protein
MSKNFGTRGVADATQLGKRGSYLADNPSAPGGQRAEVRQSDGVTLGRMAGAVGTDAADFVTRAQLDAFVDPMISLAYSYAAINLINQVFPTPPLFVVLASVPIPTGFSGSIWYEWQASIGTATNPASASVKGGTIGVRRANAAAPTLGAADRITSAIGGISQTITFVVVGNDIEIRLTLTAPVIGATTGNVQGVWRLMGNQL